jgi:hypothetical protein
VQVVVTKQQDKRLAARNLAATCDKLMLEVQVGALFPSSGQTDGFAIYTDAKIK